MKNTSRFLSGTALATLGLVCQLGNAHAQVFVGSSQPSVEVDLDALNSLPGTGTQTSRIVRLHEPRRIAHRDQVVQYDSEYADATTVISSIGVSRAALATPDAPDDSDTPTPPKKTHAHYRHHRKAMDDAAVTTNDLNRRSLTEPSSEGLNPEIAKFDPAVMNSADLNRLQILCSAIPTPASRNPMENASFTPAPMPTVEPQQMSMAQPDAPASPAPAPAPAEDQTAMLAPEPMPEPRQKPKPVRYTPPEPAAVIAPAPKVTTASLNQRELALDTLGNADVPQPVSVTQPPSPPVQSVADAGTSLQQPINTPAQPQVDSQAEPTPTPDVQLAAIPAPPPAQNTPADLQPVSMAPAPTPQNPPSPLSDDDLRVDFQPGEAVIPSGELAKLNKVIDRMDDSEDLRIELRAFATSQADSTSMARRVSLARALAIKSYLTSRGVSDERIDVRALGSSPTDASDRVDLFLMR